MKSIGNALRWIVGILCLLSGLYGIVQIPVFGIFCMLFGISLLPAVWRSIEKRYTVKPGVAAAVPALFFVMMCFTVPKPETLYATGEKGAVVSQEREALTGETEEATKDSQMTAEVEVTVTPEVTVIPEVTESLETGEQGEIQEMKVHFLDVGQGLSVFAQCGDQNLIYDGGDRKTSSFVVAYLKEQGVTTLDYVISSHYDADHVYGLIGCINAFDVKKVIASNYEHDSETYEKFVRAADEKGLAIEYPSVGTSYAFGSGSFTILAPEEVSAQESNENSVAIKLVNGENSFLFTGDAESKSEASMCASGLDLSCDVLVPGHHGSATATSWEFLQAAVPEYAVISCGVGNSYGHPHKDTMDKLESMGVSVYRTDRQGTIVVTSDGKELSWNQEPCNDYTPGDPEDEGTQPAGEEQTEQIPKISESYQESEAEVGEVPATETAPVQEEQVWISATGSKYHNKPDCGNTNPDNARQMSRSEAENSGYEACKKCY